jgi:hypothetical protein
MKKLTVLIALVALMAVGCRMARMAVPQSLTADAAAMPVSGRTGFNVFDESISFGPYNVTEVHRGWKVKSSFGFLGFSMNKARQSFEFSIADTQQQGRAEVQCSTGVKWKDIEGQLAGGTLTVNLQAHTLYACSIKTQDAVWQLLMNEETGQVVMSGVLTDGETELAVKGTTKLEGSSFPLSDPTGYIIELDGRPVAAVEVINAGAVWIKPDLGPELRLPVASTASALLLYRDLDDQ